MSGHGGKKRRKRQPPSGSPHPTQGNLTHTDRYAHLATKARRQAREGNSTSQDDTEQEATE